MARKFFTVSSGPASVGTTAKTVLQIEAPANARYAVRRITLSGRGVSATGKPATLELVLQPSGGTGTALTPQKKTGFPESATMTARGNFTVEPSTTGETILNRGGVPVFQFMASLPEDMLGGLEIAGGTRLGFRMTLDSGETATNVEITAEIEE